MNHTTFPSKIFIGAIVFTSCVLLYNSWITLTHVKKIDSKLVNTSHHSAEMQTSPQTTSYKRKTAPLKSTLLSKSTSTTSLIKDAKETKETVPDSELSRTIAIVETSKNAVIIVEEFYSDCNKNDSTSDVKNDDNYIETETYSLDNDHEDDTHYKTAQSLSNHCSSSATKYSIFSLIPMLERI